MHDNFASVGASGGVAYISSSATMVRANTTLVVVHQPAVTCRSTPEFPCWIVLEAPEGYTLFSEGAPVTDLPCSVWPLSSTTCGAWARSCTFVVTPGKTLWANVQYCERARSEPTLSHDSLREQLDALSEWLWRLALSVNGAGAWVQQHIKVKWRSDAATTNTLCGGIEHRSLQFQRPGHGVRIRPPR